MLLATVILLFQFPAFAPPTAASAGSSRPVPAASSASAASANSRAVAIIPPPTAAPPTRPNPSQPGAPYTSPDNQLPRVAYRPISAEPPAFFAGMPKLSPAPLSFTSGAATGAPSPVTALAKSHPASSQPAAATSVPAQPSTPSAPIILTPSLKKLTGKSLSNSYLPPPAGAFRPPYETPVEHRRVWFALTAAEHSAAAYDAWSTRYALSNGRVEADPLMRPFAGSNAIYPAIQVIPIGLDFLARRFQCSSGWTRHIWWLPQSAATVTFLFSGSYNVIHTN